MTAPAPGTKEIEEVQSNRDLLFYFCVSRAPPAALLRQRTCVVLAPKAPHRRPLARLIEKSRTKMPILCSHEERGATLFGGHVKMGMGTAYL